MFPAGRQLRYATSSFLLALPLAFIAPAIRADSIVNFWLYGTTFTSNPRATRADLARRGPAKAEGLLIARLDDLVEAMANPAGNERLQFARQVIERHGIDVSTPEGKDRAGELLVNLRARMIEEANRHTRAEQGARDRNAALDIYATIYRERGLSSDTSLAVNFALDRALEQLAARGGLGPDDAQGVQALHA